MRRSKKKRPRQFGPVTLESRARSIRLKLFGGADIPTEDDIMKEVVILDAMIAVRREVIFAVTMRLSAATAAEVGKMLEERVL